LLGKPNKGLGLFAYKRISVLRFYFVFAYGVQCCCFFLANLLIRTILHVDVLDLSFLFRKIKK